MTMFKCPSCHQEHDMFNFCKGQVTAAHLEQMRSKSLSRTIDAPGPLAQETDWHKGCREQIQRMREALEVTLGNIRSIKSAVAPGVTPYDVWERVVTDALGPQASSATMELLAELEGLRKSDETFRKVIKKLMDDNGGMVPNWLIDLAP